MPLSINTLVEPNNLGKNIIRFAFCFSECTKDVGVLHFRLFWLNYVACLMSTPHWKTGRKESFRFGASKIQTRSMGVVSLH